MGAGNSNFGFSGGGGGSAPVTNTNWLLNGNTETSEKYFGTNNNFSVPIYTNGLARGIFAKEGNFGFGTVTPNSTALLDLTSTSSGLLVPRMTTLQRDAIVSPATSLFIYNISSSFFNYWDGTTWIQVDTSTGGDVSGSGTTNYAVKWTDGINSVIGDGTWYFSTNDYLPVTSGSNIGDDTHRIGTVFMASVFDYANDLTWFNGTSTTMTLTTAGDLGIGITSPIARFNVDGAGLGTYDKVFSFNDNTSSGNIISADNTGVITFGKLIYGIEPTLFNQGYWSINGYTNNNSTLFGIKNKVNSNSIVVRDSTETDTHFIIDTLGNTGIGLSAPTSILHVKGIDATSANFSLKIDDVSSAPLFYVQNNKAIGMNRLPYAQDNSLIINLGIDQNIIFNSFGGYSTIQAVDDLISVNNELRFYASAYVLNTGNVGIGVVASSKLHVRGDGDTSATYSLKVDDTNDVPLLYVRDDGNVGVGIATPTNKLQVGVTAEADGLVLTNITTGHPAANLLMNNDGGWLALAKNNINTVIIGSNPYVGSDHIDTGRNLVIGATTSTYKFQVNANSEADGIVLKNNVTNNQVAGLLKDADGGWFFLAKATVNSVILGDNPYSPLDFINTGRNLGVGLVTPTAKLHVQGIDATSGNYSFKIDNIASSPLFYVRNDGYVGVNVASPIYNFDVLGSSNFKFISSYGNYGLTGTNIEVDSPLAYLPIALKVNLKSCTAFGVGIYATSIVSAGYFDVNDSTLARSDYQSTKGIGVHGGSVNSGIEIGVAESKRGLLIGMSNTTANLPDGSILLRRLRNNGASTVVLLDGDELGSITFEGKTGTAWANSVSDSTDFTGGAYIKSFIDGTPTLNSLNTTLPANLKFYTNSGAVNTSASLRMIISTVGNVGIGIASPLSVLHVNGIDATTSINQRLEPIANVTQDITGGTIGTTDATANITAQTITMPANGNVSIESTIVYRKTAGAGVGTVGDGTTIILNTSVRSVAGVLTLDTIQNTYTGTVNAIVGCTATFTISGSNILVSVTGVLNDDVTWNVISKLNTVL